MIDVLGRLFGWGRGLFMHRRDSYINLLSPYFRSAEIDHDERTAP